jgi:hypothetical protein
VKPRRSQRKKQKERGTWKRKELDIVQRLPNTVDDTPVETTALSREHFTLSCPLPLSLMLQENPGALIRVKKKLNRAVG